MRKGCLFCRILFSTSLLVALNLGIGCGGSSDPPSGTGRIPQVAHVFVLVEENHSYSSVIGNPVMPYTNSAGVQLEGSERPLWWIYYPDARPIFSKFEVYNPKNFAARMSWEDLFESRMFSSYIVKSTVDNPFDLPLSAIYPNDDVFSTRRSYPHIFIAVRRSSCDISSRSLLVFSFS